VSIPENYTGYAIWGSLELFDCALIGYFDPSQSWWWDPDCESTGGWTATFPPVLRSCYKPLDTLPEGVPPCPAAPQTPTKEAPVAGIQINPLPEAKPQTLADVGPGYYEVKAPVAGIFVVFVITDGGKNYTGRLGAAHPRAALQLTLPHDRYTVLRRLRLDGAQFTEVAR
jgi:hypothetical protein